MNFRSRSKTVSMGFQLAPMIDIMFLLLCFFIAAQIYAQWETEIDITLPTAVSGDLPDRLPSEIIINIRSDGTTIVNRRELAAPELLVDHLARAIAAGVLADLDLADLGPRVPEVHRKGRQEHVNAPLRCSPDDLLDVPLELRPQRGRVGAVPLGLPRVDREQSPGCPRALRSPARRLCQSQPRGPAPLPPLR